MILRHCLRHEIFPQQIGLTQNVNDRLLSASEARTSVKGGRQVASVVGIDHVVDIDDILIQIVDLNVVRRERFALGMLKRCFGDQTNAVNAESERLLRDDRFKAGLLLPALVVDTVLLALLVPENAGNRLVLLRTAEAQHLFDTAH